MIIEIELDVKISHKKAHPKMSYFYHYMRILSLLIILIITMLMSFTVCELIFFFLWNGICMKPFFNGRLYWPWFFIFEWTINLIYKGAHPPPIHIYQSIMQNYFRLILETILNDVVIYYFFLKMTPFADLDPTETLILLSLFSDDFQSIDRVMNTQI